MLFRDVVGQEAVKSQLIQAWKEGRISHAQLFHGPAGSGNFALALAYARFLSCPNKQESDACGSCPTCKKFDSLQFADLHFSFPYFNKQTGGSVSDEFMASWRQMVQQTAYFDTGFWRDTLGAENKQLTISAKEAGNIIHKISLKSFEGGYKILIMWLPELMHISCANKLLKTIEEPPDNTLLFLVSEHPEQIISTILSRTQRIRVPALQDESIRSALISHLGLTSNEKADRISRVVDGNYFRAWQMLKHEKDTSYQERFMEWMRKCYKRDISAMVAFSDTLHAQGREAGKQFLEYALHMVRQCIVLNYAGSDITRFTPEEEAFANRFAPFINDRNVLEITSAIEVAHRDIGRNIYGKTVYLDLSLIIHRLLHA